MQRLMDINNAPSTETASPEKQARQEAAIFLHRQDGAEFH
jgi:hypothetical protein